MLITNKKSYIIQILRGIAIIAVVFIHNTPIGVPQVICRPFLNFSVGLFLFLSGVLSNADKWKPWKRIKKVAIPYLIWTLIYVVLHTYNTPVQIPIEFIKKSITGSSAAMMYYIFVYCEFTLLIPMIDKLAKSKFKYLGFAISPLEIIVMRLLPQVAGYEINKYISLIMSVSCLGWFSYFYLGYLLGNGLLNINYANAKLYIALVISLILQIAEGYWYYLMGNQNCGTQLKLSSVLTGCIFMIIVYNIIEAEKYREIKPLYLLGECSFGIYFSHIAIMSVLNHIPHYSEMIIFPINAIIALLISFLFVLVGKRLLGKNSRYLAL